MSTLGSFLRSNAHWNRYGSLLLSQKTKNKKKNSPCLWLKRLDIKKRKRKKMFTSKHWYYLILRYSYVLREALKVNEDQFCAGMTLLWWRGALGGRSTVCCVQYLTIPFVLMHSWNVCSLWKKEKKEKRRRSVAKIKMTYLWACLVPFLQSVRSGLGSAAWPVLSAAHTLVRLTLLWLASIQREKSDLQWSIDRCTVVLPSSSWL